MYIGFKRCCYIKIKMWNFLYLFLILTFYRAFYHYLIFLFRSLSYTHTCMLNFTQSKTKSERNRQRAHDSRLKSVHTQRQEAAQSRREERMRAVKERIMSEEDPDKARKLEVRPVYAPGLLACPLHMPLV
ncbi:unnamed protein product [Echinostoma caproni]|uniref:IBB domain-containing protein n=1 Tax=Echinostoma caproni TaxID=27848 RepID=A0A183A3N0_9TREM|nr:unnamed protein product [Echinostoma caproni]